MRKATAMLVVCMLLLGVLTPAWAEQEAAHHPAAGYDGPGWDHLISLAAGDGFTVGLRSDGRVAYAGDNNSDEIRKIGSWKDIARIELKSPYSRYIIGYRTDGTIALADLYDVDPFYGDLPVRWKEEDFAGWNVIADLIIERYFCVGLRTDGTVLMTVNTGELAGPYAEMITSAQKTVSEWENIVQVVTRNMDQYNFRSYSCDDIPILIVGLKEDGTVVCTDQEQLEKQNEDNPDQGEMRPWPDPREWNHVRELVVRRYGSALYPDVYGIREDGSVLGLSEAVQNVDSLYYDMNECFVLKRDGHMEYIRSMGDNWEQTAGWTDIVEIAYGYDGQYTDYGRFIARRSDGTVYHFRAPYEEDPFQSLDEWTDIIRVFNSTHNLYGLKSDGTVLSGYRNPYYMMIDEMNWIMTEYDEEIETWQDIVNIVASYGGDPFSEGHEHIVGLKSDGTAVAAGDNTRGQCNLGG